MHKQRMREENFQTEGSSRAFSWGKVRWMAVLMAALCALLWRPGTAQAQEVDSSAASAIVIDAQHGTVLLSHQAEVERPMASTTKVMTALLALEECDLTELVTAGHNAFGVPGTSIYLSEGETLTMEDMLYGLMLASGNDAAVAIAEHIDGSVAAFCERMTARARELGCEHTVFLTPHGLPQDGHYTTAHDLALIAREAMKNETFRQIVSTTRATIPWEGREYDRILNNKNKLLTTYPGATGIKTGYTRAAGRCLVSSAQRDGMELICVVLNCADWFDESARLLDAAFAEYGWFTMLEAGETVREMQVEVSDGAMLPIVAQGELGGVASKDSLPSLELELPERLEAPIDRGEPLGTARMVVQGETVAQVPLVAGEAVERDDFPHRIRHYFSLWIAF